MKKVIKYYMHSDKGDNRWKWEDELEQDPDSEAANEFSYCCYEVCLDVEVDLETGKTRVLGIHSE